MIPLPGIRDKGGGPLLGANAPGQSGPFGRYGADEDDDGPPWAPPDLEEASDAESLGSSPAGGA